MKTSKKKIFYLILVILVATMVFTVAAVCNACGANTLDENGDAGSNSNSDSSDSSQNNSSDNNNDGSGDGDGNGNGDGDGQKAPPTVKLKVYMGPEYSADDDVCFYRVEAEVTGNPEPDIEWSHDDASRGSFGKYKIQINLEDPAETVDLEATAKNSEGSAKDSVELSWGCNGENKDPEITSIDLSENDIFAGETYTVTAAANDPDGDDITYKWTASDGDISDGNGNPTEWTAPMAEGDYTITLEVRDDKGGIATQDKNVTVALILPPPVAAQELPWVIAEGGYIEETGFINAGGCMFAGDSGAPNADYVGNRGVRGYISFDISGLSDVDITGAELTLNVKQIYGDPSSFGHFYISKVSWGAEQLVVGDFNLPGFPICDFAGYGTGDLFCDSPQLEEQLQNAVDAGDQRFQLRIHFAQLSDGDNNWDGLEYEQNNVSLFVVYSPR